jgi:hypothetical protein
MKKFFLHNGSEQEGPFDLDDLKSKVISKDTPIWHEGLNDWTTIDKIDELKDIIRTSTPPPFVSKQLTSVSTSIPRTDQQNFTSPTKQKSKFNFWSVLQILAGLFLGGLLILFLINNFNDNYSASGNSYEQKVMTIEEIERATPTDFLSASGTYNKNFWGNKFIVNCLITNKATVATYKDAVIRITYYSKTETDIGSKVQTIYETFPPSSTKTVKLKIDDYNDVSSIGWEVINATSN